MREIEVKLKVSGVSQIRAALRRLGWRVARRRCHEKNTVYDRPGDSWLMAGRLMRVREVGKSCQLTVKLPVAYQGDHKVREEHEIMADDPVQLLHILDALEFEPEWRYEKFRTEFRKPRESGKILLDETPVGDYLELEGAADWIDRTAERLGFSKSDYIVASYRGLFVDYVAASGGKARDMLFGEDGLCAGP